MLIKNRSGNRPRKRVDREPRRSRNNSNNEYVIIGAQPTLTLDLIFIALVAPTCVVFVVVVYFFFLSRAVRPDKGIERVPRKRR